MRSLKQARSATGIYFPQITSQGYKAMYAMTKAK